MQSKSDQFRAHAQECRELASRVYGRTREQYEELARQWLELAEWVELAARRRRERDGGGLSISKRLRLRAGRSGRAGCGQQDT